jgi:UPF0042 nucleotide-binding protein
MKLIIVSGRSGSGKTVALRVLEDLGYYCVDNLPVSLLYDLVSTIRGKYHNLAVSIDVRNLPEENEELVDMLQQLRTNSDLQLSSFFIDADNATLVKRYGDTRRLHPLSRQKLTH